MATVWLLKQTSNRRSVAGCRLHFLTWRTHEYLKIIGHVTHNCGDTAWRVFASSFTNHTQLCVWAEAEPLRLTGSERRLQLNCRTLEAPRRPPTSNTERVYFCNFKWTVREKTSYTRGCVYVCVWGFVLSLFWMRESLFASMSGPIDLPSDPSLAAQLHRTIVRTAIAWPPTLCAC